MSEPSVLRLKRKATDDAPGVLILEQHLKRAKLHYVRKADDNDSTNGIAALQQEEPAKTVSERKSGLEPSGVPIKRLYHLSRKRKASREADNVATFVEKKRKDNRQAPVNFEEVHDELRAPSPQKQLKKPSRGAAVSDTNKLVQHVETDTERKKMEELSNYYQNEFAEEVESERRTAGATKITTSYSQSKRITPPKLSGQRSKELHRQRVATNASLTSNGDVQMEDDSDYVYDTYILAPVGGLDTAKIDAQTGLTNVGYLVITAEDESLWSTYLVDDPSDEEGGGDSDEFDENAEDFYGADYPEDELASDDEFDRNGYAYRRKGAFDEEYDEDTGAYSDDEDKFERLTDPFGCGGGLPKRFADGR